MLVRRASKLLMGCTLAGLLAACGGGGSDGKDGANGAAGAPGAPGTPGANGTNALVTITAEPAGASCANGGSRVDSGLDINASSTLDAAEITGSQYACNGVAGTNGAPGAPGSAGADGVNSLVVRAVEPIGANCPAGGQRFTAGLDANDNGTLEAGEINSSGYVCNGAAGAAGTAGINSLTAMATEAAGANCANGGVKLTTGPDADANGTLDAVEINTTRYVCNGVNGTNGTNGSNGLNALIRTDAEAAGANCAYGGTKISAGVDINDSSVLDTGEVTATAYACNGTPGSGVVWSSVSATTVQAAGNHGYFANNATEEIVITLPASPAVGDVIQINGLGLGGWRVAQNAGQQIITGSLAGPLSNTWSPRDSKRAWQALAMSASGRRQAAAVYNGAIYYSNDFGASWRVSDAPTDNWAWIAASGDGLRMMANALSETWVSNDGGAHWTQATVPWGPGFPRFAYSADATRILVEKNGEQLRVSSDGGVSWSNVESARSWSRVASSVTGQQLVAAVDGGLIYVSTDYGVTWTPRGTSRFWDGLACSADCTHIVAADNGGRIYVSHDTGVTWTAGGPAGGPFYTATISANGRRVTAGELGGWIYVSDDGGATWAKSGDYGSWGYYAASADGLRITGIENGGAGGFIWTSNRDELDASAVGTSGHLLGGQYSGATLVYSGGGQFVVTNAVGLLDAR